MPSASTELCVSASANLSRHPVPLSGQPGLTIMKATCAIEQVGPAYHVRSYPDGTRDVIVDKGT
jgi:hypothetical protein